MFDTENLEILEVKLLNGQIDLILKALELYAFNLHNVWGLEVDENLQELRNALVFHTYQQLIAKKNNSNYRITYDVMDNCKREMNRKKYKKYLSMKNGRKYIA